MFTVKQFDESELYLSMSVRDRRKVCDNALRSITSRIMSIKEDMAKGMWSGNKSIELDHLRSEREIIEARLRQLDAFSKA